MDEREKEVLLERCPPVQLEALKKFMAEGWIITGECLNDVLISKGLSSKWVMPDGTTLATSALEP